MFPSKDKPQRRTRATRASGLQMLHQIPGRRPQEFLTLMSGNVRSQGRFLVDKSQQGSFCSRVWGILYCTYITSLITMFWSSTYPSSGVVCFSDGFLGTIGENSDVPCSPATLHAHSAYCTCYWSDRVDRRAPKRPSPSKAPKGMTRCYHCILGSSAAGDEAGTVVITAFGGNMGRAVGTVDTGAGVKRERVERGSAYTDRFSIRGGSSVDLTRNRRRRHQRSHGWRIFPRW